jgi:hypothetical protein
MFRYSVLLLAEVMSLELHTLVLQASRSQSGSKRVPSSHKCLALTSYTTTTTTKTDTSCEKSSHNVHNMPPRQNTILCVAEKPSIAKAVANHLSTNVQTVRDASSRDMRIVGDRLPREMYKELHTTRTMNSITRSIMLLGARAKSS